MEGALSKHADEVLNNLVQADEKAQVVTEGTFRALTDVERDGRAVRRALPFSRLLAETGADEADLHRVIDRFRAFDCNFLTPPPNVPIEQATFIDISHEALIRRWRKLGGSRSRMVGLTRRR
jgi:hypothetical protein